MSNLENLVLSKKFELIEYLKRFIGQPYYWGGDGSHFKGFDCSGLILEGFYAIGLLGNIDMTSKGIYEKFVKSETFCKVSPQAGDILFFGRNKDSIIHIALALSPTTMLEAGGGGSTSNTGMVRIRPIKWRRDLYAIADIISLHLNQGESNVRKD